MLRARVLLLSLLPLLGVACTEEEPKTGTAEGGSADGDDGADGEDGTDGADGADGADGTDGTDGADGADGADGTDGGEADGSDDGEELPELPDLDAIEAALWADWVAGAPSDWSTPTASGERREQSLSRGGSTMRYTVERRGSAAGSVPLYIGLHGGGSAPASVNDSQWVAMQTYYRDSVAEGIYVAPRGVSDNWNLHFEGDSYPLYDQLIERMIVQENVDPDRVYLLGFSAGGDGVYQVAPKLADRWAGANMSAGHPNGVPATNLANVAFLLQMGEYDTAYDRHREAALYNRQLDGLEAGEPGLYVHELYLHKNGTHNYPWSDRDPSGTTYPVIADPDAWLDSGDRSSINVDSNAVAWLSAHVRSPWPETVVWSLGTWAGRDGREVAHYWLAVETPGSGTVRATVDGDENLVEIDASGLTQLSVRLNHHMVDLRQPVTVRVGDLEQSLQLYPSETLMAETLALRGDPRQIYSAELELRWEGEAVTITALTPVPE